MYVGLRASPVEVGRVVCPSTTIETSVTSLVALTRAETVTGPAGTFALACGWIVLMIGPRPVAVGDAAGAITGEAAGARAGSGVVPVLTGDDDTTTLLLALAMEPGRAPSSGRLAGFAQPAAIAATSPTTSGKRSDAFRVDAVRVFGWKCTRVSTCGLIAPDPKHSCLQRWPRNRFEPVRRYNDDAIFRGGVSMQLSGMDHIVLSVRDVERSLDFYTRVLGLQPERVDTWRAGKNGFPSVRINDNTIIDLMVSKAGDDAVTVPNLNHFCMFTDGPLEPCVDELHKHGIAIETGPISRWGARGNALSVYLRDPDDNLVEIRSYVSAPQSAEARTEVAARA
jgi:catechol 2,3-dioxygenase-like lactoylglutathione lyase family enzyme